jgi:hypothetical protein
MTEQIDIPEELSTNSATNSASQGHSLDLAFFEQFVTSRGMVLFLQKHFNLSFALVKSKMDETW